MSDEFPTLEAAAALGVLALGVRTVVLARQAYSIRRDNDALVAALRSGAHTRAIELCARAESPAYADIARGVLRVVEEGGPKLETARYDEELARAAHTGLVQQRRRFQTGRARDLIALAVLFGALAYGLGGGLDASTWFLALVALACVVLLLSLFVRGIAARELRASLKDLLAAAAQSGASAPEALSDGPCRACGKAEQIVLRDLGALSSGSLGLSILELRICRNCGELHGKVKDPARIPVGHQHGTALAVTPDPIGISISSSPREHEG